MVLNGLEVIQVIRKLRGARSQQNGINFEMKQSFDLKGRKRMCCDIKASIGCIGQ
jgi:nucleoside diphosphate kinase